MLLPLQIDKTDGSESNLEIVTTKYDMTPASIAYLNQAVMMSVQYRMTIALFVKSSATSR